MSFVYKHISITALSLLIAYNKLTHYLMVFPLSPEEFRQKWALKYISHHYYQLNMTETEKRTLKTEGKSYDKIGKLIVIY